MCSDARTGPTEQHGSRQNPGDAEKCSAYDLVLLRKAVRPFTLHWFPELPSTNDLAGAWLASRKPPLPLIVLTERQSAGRGRGLHRWWSSGGSLTASFVIPAREDLVPSLLPILVGVVVRDAIVALTGSQQVSLKWPNDVLFAGRKLAGILCERRLGGDIIGVGMNVSVTRDEIPLELRERVASVAELAAHPISLTDAVDRLARQLRVLGEPWQPDALTSALETYNRHHILHNRTIEVEADDGRRISGVCHGIDPMGRLLLSANAETHRLTGGSVRIVG